MPNRREIPIRFTPKQKELVQAFLGRAVKEVNITIEHNIVLKYGYMPAPRTRTKNMIPLTSDQQELLKKELNVNCEYIELTKDMTFK